MALARHVVGDVERESAFTGPEAAADEPGAVVVARGLVKDFGRTRALSGLDLTVRAGEVHGLLGPNGAGKSTTLRALLGLLRLDAGSVRLLGGEPWRDARRLHRRLSYVPGDVVLWPSLTGGEVIDLLGRLHGGSSPARREELLQRLDLDPTRRCRSYSKGNRQKVVLVAAFAAQSELLLMDEPTAGLDPLMEAEFQHLVREERTQGRSVLLSSHLLSEVESLCDRVSIVRSGQVVDSGRLEDLRHLHRTSVVAAVREPAIADGLRGLPTVHDWSREGPEVRCAVDTGGLDDVMAGLSRAGLLSVTTRPPSLEELFLQHYAVGNGPARSAPAVRS